MNAAPDEFSSQDPGAQIADDFATLLVAKPVVSQTQAAPEAASPTGANPDAAVPFVFGRRIAQGGMGAILEADDCKLGRKIAVKVMLLEAGCSEEQKQRFIQEAAVLGRLEHPNIVPIHDLGRDSAGQLYYSMKLVKGRTLQDILHDLRHEKPEALQHYTLDRLLTVFRKVCDALAFAHAQKIIHRDLKPENIMVGEFGEVLVMDWGISKILDGSAEIAGGDVLAAPGTPSNSGSFTATMDGAVMGTPQYMSPEQAMGRVAEMDARSDIFSLGGILYAILTLRPPVEGKDVWEVLEKVSTASIAAPHQGEGLAKSRPSSARHLASPSPWVVPAALSAVAMKALTLDKAQRYQNVMAFSADIEAYQNGFATSAEQAGSWRQFTLLVKRNKAASIGIVAVLFVGVTFGTKAIVEGRRAEREAAAAKAALAGLRATAPTFNEQAKLLTAQEKLPEALEKIGMALTLNAGESGFHAQRGNILQSMERFTEAADSYAVALRLNPQEPHASENVELSRMLAADAAKDATLSIDNRVRWRDALLQQGREAEAIFAARSTAADAAKMLPAWQARLDAWLGKDAPRLKLASDGLSGLDLKGRSLTDLSPIRGMPIRNLHLEGNPQIADISPLADCPITELYMAYHRKLVDLSPLKGKNLRLLGVGDTGVRDLQPLAGMKELTYLDIVDDPVRDLTPIREARLKELHAHSSGVQNLEPLRGQPLEILDVSYHTIDSLDPVGDAPLRILQISRCGHLDLAHVRTRRLQHLSAQGTVLDHLEVLAEMTELRSIHLPKNLTDPGILRELPQLKKIGTGHVNGVDDSKDAADFWRDYDAKKAADGK